MEVDKSHWAYQAKYLIDDVPYLLCDQEPNTVVAGDPAYLDYCKKKEMFLSCIPFYSSLFEIKRDGAGRLFITDCGLKKWCKQYKVFPIFLFPEHVNNKAEPQQQKEHKEPLVYIKKEALLYQIEPLVKDKTKVETMLSNAPKFKNKALFACMSPDKEGWHRDGVIAYIANNTDYLKDEYRKRYSEMALEKTLGIDLNK